MTREEKLQQIQTLIMNDQKLIALLRLVVITNLPNQSDEKLDEILVRLSN